MSSGETPTGPDLEAGVPAHEVVEGTPFRGTVRGEPVVLVRQGAEVFAVGGSCTHYGAPLADGLVVDGTLRCPWHHACFSLRTGAALRAPALNPLARYRVESQGARLRVAERLSEPAPAAGAKGPSSVVIVGAGAAGNAAAESLREAGYGGPVTLLGADEAGPYDRPNLSKDYLAGKAQEEWIPLRGADFYRERGIDLRVGTRVAAIDPASRTVTLADGTTLGWGALLLATGADPVRLPVPGAELPHVRVLRTLADSRALVERAQSARRVVVVGASFIGLEVAAALRERGLEVHVVGPEPRPFERVLGPAVGDFVRALHEEHGVVFHLGASVQAIEANRVTLGDGSAIEADLLAVGIGVRPALALAEAAGLALDRGVVVDEHLQTSVAGIYAAGDIARWPDPHSGQKIRVEHWVVAERMGQVAAQNILGRGIACDVVPFFWSAHYDVTINYVGHAERWDRIDVHGDLAARDCTLAYRLEGKTLAVVTIGRDRTSLEAEAAFERADAAALAELGRSR